MTKQAESIQIFLIYAPQYQLCVYITQYVDSLDILLRLEIQFMITMQYYKRWYARMYHLSVISTLTFFVQSVFSFARYNYSNYMHVELRSPRHTLIVCQYRIQFLPRGIPQSWLRMDLHHLFRQKSCSLFFVNCLVIPTCVTRDIFSSLSTDSYDLCSSGVHCCTCLC